MPNINEAGVLITELSCINAVADAVGNGLSITPALLGSHGIGKTQIVKQAAQRFPNNQVETIDLSQAGDGDNALPFAFKNEDGTSEVRYVLYHVWSTIQRLEKEIYDRAQKDGLLNGTVRLKIDSEGNEHLIVDGKDTIVRTPLQKLKDGDFNRYKFGDQLPGELKMKLLENGEVTAFFVLLDELNRADMQVMKQFMNIILERDVYGYTLPWWVQLVVAMNPCSQNTSYATNQLDPAQWSRFLKIRVDTSIESFVQYAMKKGLSLEVVEALANTDIFVSKDKSTADEDEMSPDPRAWEMVCNIYQYLHQVLSSKLFNADERKNETEHLRILIRGKVGEVAARTLMQAINDKENNIKANEIINGKELKINKDVLNKLNRQHDLAKLMTSYKVIELIAKEIADVEKAKTSADPKQKEYYANWTSQLKEFSAVLPPATAIMFVKGILNHENGASLFNKASKYFTKEILASIIDTKAGLNDLNNND